MPELPEVEVTRRGIAFVLEKAVIEDVFFSDKKLREPFSKDLKNLCNSKVTEVLRRGKYIIIKTSKGSILLHLGMSGHLRVALDSELLGKHDHFKLTLNNGHSIVLNDTRRFGLVKFFPPDLDPICDDEHVKKLGPEPFSDEFNADYLLNSLKNRKLSIKQAIMDGAIVVGVGNIYASEILFSTHISPLRQANSITYEECKLIVESTKSILKKAISKGGTTIRDFEGADGKMGYFVQDLLVYGHEGELCRNCGGTIKKIIQGQRSTYFCPCCQK